jgi:hypothetical protein
MGRDPTLIEPGVCYVPGIGRIMAVDTELISQVLGTWTVNQPAYQTAPAPPSGALAYYRTDRARSNAKVSCNK